MFDLACSAVHPVRCTVVLSSQSPDDLLDLACAHGARAHGFTPAWYGPQRRGQMARMITQRCG
jgi:hypothetical protein